MNLNDAEMEIKIVFKNWSLCQDESTVTEKWSAHPRTIHKLSFNQLWQSASFLHFPPILLTAIDNTIAIPSLLAKL